ncbi:MAG: hypothetical protein ACREXT_15185, partial [Gammaproteobacteria bacterium]
MGKLDSSRTRVQPVFKALHRSDATGATWLGPLMQMGGREAPVDPGRLSDPPKFEFGAQPPRVFLEWLVKHPER